jgi:predicted MPP superfamily phosphohydrolase
MLYIVRPNLGQPIIATISELVSGISLIVSSEPDVKDSDIKTSLKDGLAIRPIDQKGIKFPLTVTNVQKAKVNYQEDISFKYVETHLIVYNVFETEKETAFWEVTVCIPAGNVLGGKKKRLFDVLLAHGSDIKENNHALCVYESIGNNLSFIHSCDLHLAKRNDKILEKIKAKAPQNEYEDARRNFINFNDNFRHLIRYINNHSDEIDFLIVSGDLVDYYQPDELYDPDQPFEGEVCSFEKSNLSIFYDAVLGRGLNQNNELTVPIFTTTGNHDFRPYHYNLGERGQFKKFRLIEKNISYLDEKPIRPLDSILPASVKWLKEYFKRINPDLDYLVRFGNTDLMFLDGGKDNYSFFHLWDALGGSPDTDCITDLQIGLINSYFESKKNEGPILIVMHTPSINIRGGYKKEELYEDYRERTTGNPWIDYRDNDLSYGSLAYNWERFLEVLTGLTNEKGYKVDLVLSGHVHQDIEFRLKPYYDDKNKRNKVGIYCWDYSKKLIESLTKTPEERKQWWEKNKPFVLQTAATGPLGNDEPEVRRIIIENGQVKWMTPDKIADLR